MFHRFHDLKAQPGQDSDMMSGGSRSNTPAAEGTDARPMYPLMPRPDLNLSGHQLATGSQYGSGAHGSGSGFVSQGASLMALGHNMMFQGASKLMAGSSQDAQRYMEEAYRLAAAGEGSVHRMGYGSLRMHQDHQLNDAMPRTSATTDRQLASSASHRQHQVERGSFGYGSPQSSVDAARTDRQEDSKPQVSDQRLATTLDRLDHARPAAKTNDFKGAFPAGHSSGQTAHGTKGKGSGQTMFPMPFSPYHQYPDETANYKRHYYDEARRELAESLNPADQLLNISKTRDPAVSEKIVQELSRFESCVSQDVYQHLEGGRPNQNQDGNQVSPSTSSAEQAGLLQRPKICKGRQPKNYRCDLCDQEFKNSTQLKNHTWRHTGEKPYSCNICQATFTQQSNLKTHLRIHTGERPYTCEECNATFTQVSNLRTHQKIHTGEKPYECDVCFTRFSQQSNLKSHKLIHSGERPFKCEECGASFVQSTHLRNHKRIHTNERPYSCEQCGAKFRQLSNLKTHEKIHTGERPHICDICGSAFAQKSNLKSHKIKLHNNDGTPTRRGRKKKLEAIRPYICEQCGAKFTMMSNLKIHMRLHTGEKPYQCSTCGASFAQKSNLKTHESTHTDERPYQCQECPAAFRQKTNLKTHKMKKHPVKSLKIKILQDSQYIMQDLMQGGGGAGDESSSHIEEPIVQIREGERENLHLLEGASEMEEAEDEEEEDEEEEEDLEEEEEEETFKQEDTYDTDGGGDVGQQGMCPPYPGDSNPYDSQNF